MILVTLLVQAAFRALLPIGYQQIFDRAILGRDSAFLGTVLALLFGGWTLQAAASLIEDQVAARTGSHVMRDLRRQMFDQLLRLPVSYYARTDSGDLMSRFSNDLAVIENALVRTVHTFLFSAVILVGSIVLLFVVEWRLALVTFIALPVALFGPRFLSGRAQRLAYEVKRFEATVASFIQEAIASHTVVRIFSLQESRRRRFADQTTILARKTQTARFASALVGRTASQSVYFVQILVMGLGAYLALEGFLTVGALIGFVALLLNVANAANHLSGAVPDLLQASGGMQRVQEFLTEEPAVHDLADARPLPRLAEQICFEDVSFGYRIDSADLREISFAIGAGESVAIVGRSGSGKSTILRLLMRLYDPHRGRVTLDGVDLRHGSERSLRDQIGVVLQETVLFNASLRDNLRVGNPEASDDEIRRAARMVELDDWIMRLPQRYDTVVGERGGQLSGGERQRVAIARALLRDPSLLLLDEATSALDPATASAVNQTLIRLTRGRTVVATTHRLRSITHMDRILVVESGHIAEQGPHERLLSLRGVYASLWQKQSGFTLSADGASAEVSPERLQAIPLLSGLDRPRLEAIADLLVPELYPADRILFMQDDPGNKFFLIVHGKVEVILSPTGSRGGGVRKLQDGDYFGELALIDRAPRNATVRTATATLLLSLGRRQFLGLLADVPALRAAIEQEARHRRRDASGIFETVAFKPEG